MKLYLAAPWSHMEEAREAARKLTAAGHRITEPWWDHRDVNGIDDEADELVDQAWRDLEGVDNADRFILLNLGKSEGKAVELGWALCRRIMVIAVGKRGEHSNNVFHYLPQIKWVSTIEELIEWLKKRS